MHCERSSHHAISPASCTASRQAAQKRTKRVQRRDHPGARAAMSSARCSWWFGWRLVRRSGWVEVVWGNTRAVQGGPAWRGVARGGWVRRHAGRRSAPGLRPPLCGGAPRRASTAASGYWRAPRQTWHRRATKCPACSEVPPGLTRGGLWLLPSKDCGTGNGRRTQRARERDREQGRARARALSWRAQLLSRGRALVEELLLQEGHPSEPEVARRGRVAGLVNHATEAIVAREGHVRRLQVGGHRTRHGGSMYAMEWCGCQRRQRQQQTSVARVATRRS